MRRSEELIELVRREARDHLSSFLPIVWPAVNPGAAFQSNWHIDAIAEHLEAVTAGEISSLLICLPPGACKSSLVSEAWPCWTWLRRELCPRRWIFCTNSIENARKEATFRRAILTSEIYADLRPEVELSMAGRRVQLLRNTLQGEFRASSTLSSITGAHFDVQVIDDPHDAQRIAPEELAGVVTWYDEVLSTRRRDGCATVCIQQRLAPGDLAGHLMDLGVDAVISLPAVYVPGADLSHSPLGWRDPRTETGELLWPARQSAEYLAQRRKIAGPLAYSAQYQQQPHLAGGQCYRAAWFLRFDPAATPPEAMIDWLISVDTASSLRDSADLTVIQVWARDSHDHAWLYEQISGHWAVTEQADRVYAALGRWPACHRVLVEERNGAFALVAVLQGGLKNRGAALWRWKSQIPKTSRIESVSALVECGAVHVCSGAEGDALINQACEFPLGRHDDMIDAAAMALSVWRARLSGVGESVDQTGLAPGQRRVRKGETIRTNDQRSDGPAPSRRARRIRR